MSGFTDYSGKKGRTKYGFSGETTQFEDALIKHNVITREQALLNKGMDEEDVAKLLVEEAIQETPVNYHVKESRKTEREVELEEDLEDDDDLDEVRGGGASANKAIQKRSKTHPLTHLFPPHSLLHSPQMLAGFEDDFNMDQYKEKRKMEIVKERQLDLAAKDSFKRKYRFGDFVEINREDWEREVNQGSLKGQWVVVVLTSDAVEEAKAVEASMKAVAEKFKSVKFLKIRSKSAIERWPDANLPTVFCYVNGEMHKQMIGSEQCGGPGTNAGRLEWRLKRLGVLEDSVMEKDAPRTKGAVGEIDPNKMGELERKGMSTMSTYGTEDDEEAYE
jgi:hypothetical protein